MKHSTMQLVFSFTTETPYSVFDDAMHYVANDLARTDKDFVIKELVKGQRFITYLVNDGQEWEVDVVSVPGSPTFEAKFNSVQIACDCGCGGAV